MRSLRAGINIASTCHTGGDSDPNAMPELFHLQQHHHHLEAPLLGFRFGFRALSQLEHGNVMPIACLSQRRLL